MRRLAGALLAVGLVSGLVSACGTTSETRRAAGIVPTDALAYVSLTLDPSILQKKDLFQIGQKFPAAAKLITGNFDVSRDNLLESAVKRVCLDYRTEVKPWLGSELAVALLPPPRGGTTPATAVFIKVNHAGKAKAALDHAVSKSCSGGLATSSGLAVQYRFVSGYAVVVAEHDPADSTLLLDAVENEAAKGTGGLAATPAFANAVAHLASDRLAVGWVNVPALTRLATNKVGSVGGTNVSGIGNCDLSSVGFGPAAGELAFDVRATPSSLIMDGVATGATSSLSRGPATITKGLPGSTLAEATIYGLGPLVRSALSCSGMAGRVDSSFTRDTGLDLNDDVLLQLGGESVVVVDTVPPGDRLPEIGFVTAITDVGRAQHAIDQVVAKLRANGETVTETTIGGVLAYKVDLQTTSDVLTGVEPTFALLGDRLVVASTPQYLATLASPKAPLLGSAPDYRNAVASASGDATSAQVLVRFGPIRSALDSGLSGSAKSTFDRRIAPELAALRDLVVRSYVRAGVARFELRLTFS